jgi:REP element-mobilizing transposase RayT
MERPIAYFLTWQCYGCWLHGDARESVDKQHNTFGTPRLKRDDALWRQRSESMTQDQFLLDDVSRPVVERAIRDHCALRGWSLHAVNARTTHLHVVATASSHSIEVVMEQLKAWSTRRLCEAGLIQKGRRVWASHGSTVYVFQEDRLADVVKYVLEGQ